MKRFMMFTTLIAMLFASVIATAQPRRGMQGGRQRMEAPRKNAMEELGLSKEQKTKLREVFMSARKQGIEIRAKQQVARLEMQELMAAESPDKAKIDAKIAEISKLHESTMKHKVETMLAAQQVLTPEQREKAKEMRIFSRMQRGQRHFGKGMRGRGGQFRQRAPRSGGFGQQGAFLDEEAGLFDEFEN